MAGKAVSKSKSTKPKAIYTPVRFDLSFLKQEKPRIHPKTLIDLEAVLIGIANGLSVQTACKEISVTQETYYLYRRNSEKFCQMVDKAYDHRVQAVEHALFQNATVGGNITAQIFFLQNRAPHRWQDKRNVEHSGQIHVTSSMPEPSSIIDAEVIDAGNGDSDKQ